MSVPDELPSSWSFATVGQISNTMQYGYTASASETKCGPRFLRISDIQNGAVAWSTVPYCKISEGEIEKYSVKAGDVLVARTGGTVGKSFLISDVPEPTVFASYLIRISPHPAVEPSYLFHFFQSGAYWQQIGLKKGGLLGNVNSMTLSSIELPTCPRAEQRRIVSKIDELFSRIDEGEAALARVEKLVERYRQSVLKAAVTGELTREWRAARKHAGEPVESGAALLARILKARRAAWEAAELAKMQAKGKPPTDERWKQKYKEPAPPDTTDLPALPDGWAWASMEQLVSEFGNGLSRKPSESPPGLPILRISAVRSMSVDASDVRYYVQTSGEVIDGFKVLKGDLLFTRYNGSKALVGVSGVYGDDTPVLHPDKLIKARVVDPSLVLPSFLAIACNAGEGWAHISSWVKTSAGQHGIAGSDIKRTPIPLPPRIEQERISALVERCSETSASMWTAGAAEARRSAALRQAILKAAFSGQLVPQDPNDEPAEKLLERIAAGRAVAAPVSRKRTKNTA